MKKIIQKSILLLLVLVGLMVVVSGCGKKQKEDDKAITARAEQTRRQADIMKLEDLKRAFKMLCVSDEEFIELTGKVVYEGSMVDIASPQMIQLSNPAVGKELVIQASYELDSFALESKLYMDKSVEIVIERGGKVSVFLDGNNIENVDPKEDKLP